MTKLKIKDEKHDGGTRHVLSGSLDEDAGLPLNRLSKSLVTGCRLNLQDVDSVNSLGARSWVSFIRALPLGLKGSIEAAPPVFVSQMNLIPAFAGPFQVESVLIPYYCKKCDLEHVALRQLQGPTQTLLAPSLAPGCPQCAKPMHLGVDADYLDFLNGP